MATVWEVNGDADITALGALLGDPSRCRVLMALAASVLAAEAGALGAALAERLFALRWLRPARHGRAVLPTDSGRDGLRSAFGIELDRQAAGRV